MKNWRINLIFILIFLFGAAIIGRLIYIQIIQHGFYKALAQGQQGISHPVQGSRGEIIFKGGQALAVNARQRYAYISPFEIEQKEETANVLSEILGLEKEEVIKKVNKNNLFEKIKDDLKEEEYENLKQKELKGVYISEALVRSYPQNLMASAVVGFLGGDDSGQYGLEGYYNDSLKGEEYISSADKKEGKGSDILLVIDYNIQFMAEKLLKRAEEGLKIEGGQIIVMDPNSGRILALANHPNFNPNKYYEINDFQTFQNPAIQNFFEPGSVFKAITMAGALDQKKVTPETTYVDQGKVKIGHETIYNYNQRVFGVQTMTQVLEKSINTGAVFTEDQLGHDSFLDYLNRFGLFEPTGIDLQGEVFSQNIELKKGYEMNFSTASFGQGIEITPIQLIRAFSVIANGGKLVKPYIVESILGGDRIKETKQEILRDNIVSEKTASQLTAMLVSVVENGFGKAAKVPGYYIAGKTGTAQVSWSALGINRKGYSDKTWQSFIGFGPAFDARFVILIKLDNPETGTAEYSAAPIFKEFAKYVIDYLEIPPDYE